MTRIPAGAWRTGLFALVMAALLGGVITVIDRPVAGDTRAYTALFTDASGLRAGDDVRLQGVQVGKVGSVRLRDHLAEVRFTVRREHPVYEETVPAIRYQNLTGQRFVDLRQPAHPGVELAEGAVIGTEHTLGSFDITALFNGLQPVLTRMSPEAVNRFAENMLALFDGDEARIGPALEAVEELSGYAVDQQAVLSTLLRNLRLLSDQLVGRSPHTVTLFTALADVFTVLEGELDGVVEYSERIPSLFEPLDRLAASVGLAPERADEFDRRLRELIPDPAATRDLLARIPALLQSLGAAVPVPEALSVCGHGPAEVPEPLAILIGGQRISICKR
ncbi:MCE family protein [Nocardia puris]|uniref:Phospholipid/cholesterol/gamma-HCH transport system substrate-binding protein n=1 Tax=Nocardia puris TaxID=208602 RepID=A0A366E136_9NOCA|nr:MlaD family protein [Nocardia puris]MBF6209645.1 MCE family protein [Nocardia puris]MBF6366217.1 MCE family protein [Nocardia puris]MBF6458444.1 MCE family protein [Nocardia puris]RBO96091.1 phospholipid/cholesterol/gamma-HCH transport system substrate-binding protein [Nocardia puris]